MFPELKTPARLRAKGFDIEKALADILTKNKLVTATVKGRPAIQLQVFEQDSLQRLTALLPTLPRHFLIGSADEVKKWLAPENIATLKTFATGIAPTKQIIDANPDIVAKAHEAGLAVVPYTFSSRSADTREALTADMRKFVATYKVDGLFTDNPDLFPR